MITESSLYKKILSKQNIFSAIYSLESYIFEKNLLSDSDLAKYYDLADKYNEKLISDTIKKCQSILKNILTTDELFKAKVYFKAKSYDEKQDKVIFRPMHCADLITQICIVSLLNVVMFKEGKDGERQLSDLSQLLPSNFYGNLPSTDYSRIFYNWQSKYKEYAEIVIQGYEKAKNTNTYKFEVSLDLKNYFPSIDPQFIYNFVLEKLSPIYHGNEFICLQVVLKKLLLFTITNLSSEESDIEYYADNYNIDFAKNKYNLGIPQGLPQAYYFGNLCMIPIAKIFEDFFQGEAYYYVDDSVIYTNSEKASQANFQNALNEVNSKISQIFMDHKDIDNAFPDFDYSVSVHTENKSISSEIANSWKMNRAFLMPIALEASRISFEIYTSFDSIQDTLLLEKNKTIVTALENEISKIKEEIDRNKNAKDNEAKLQQYETYLKSLKRYKKFFLYRERLLHFRQGDEILSIQDEFSSKYLLEKEELSKNDKNKIFEYFDEDIFMAEAQLIYKNTLGAKNKNKFVDCIKRLEISISNNKFLEQLYFNLNFKDIQHIDLSYQSLEKLADKIIPNFLRKPPESYISYLEKKILTIKDNSPLWLGFGKDSSMYNGNIFKHSKQYRRTILNASISKVFSVELSNDCIPIKKDKRTLKYYELRILLYLRNKNWREVDFFTFSKSVLLNYNNEGYEKIDFTLYEVLNIFRTYIQHPKLVDDLVLTHKYISSIWKNGSKFLYFYTLHNHEHSVELILSAVSICKTIDYLQIKNIDYYLLFLACYLHDISMVLHPDLDNFFKTNEKTDEVYTKFQEHLCEAMGSYFEKSTQKDLMRKSFDLLTDYYETLSRENHAHESAQFIKNNYGLSFLEILTRNTVADISEAHSYDCLDIYNLKSKAKSDAISIKYLMIILRLADLFDISKDRVSLNILKQNIRKMPSYSKYHWISHSSINSIKIYSKYSFSERASKSNGTLLKKENFLETIIVKLSLNTSNFTKVNPASCKKAHATINIEEGKIEIDLGKDTKGKDLRCSSKCNFLCKWILNKNEYLLNELNALQQYLDRNSNNTFTTKIKLVLDFSKATPLPPEYFDILTNQIK